MVVKDLIIVEANVMKRISLTTARTHRGWFPLRLPKACFGLHADFGNRSDGGAVDIVHSLRSCSMRDTAALPQVVDMIAGTKASSKL